MLTKNIYIMYPAGYFGTFVNWAIHRADADLRLTTVDNPVNRSGSTKLGGVGTSHLHKKVPTHNPTFQHIMWMLYNRPTEKKIYNINISSDDDGALLGINGFVELMMASDPTGIFINIHDNNNIDVRNFGSITGLIKWPMQVAVMQQAPQKEKTWAELGVYEFDPYDCSTDLLFRNTVVTNGKLFLKANAPIDYTALDRQLHKYLNWYNLRHQFQPQEVNSETYLDPNTYMEDTVYRDRIFELSCLDIVQQQFPTWLDNVLIKSQASSSHDVDFVKEAHGDFMATQSSLQWFAAIQQWRDTGKLNDYIMSHMLMQGLVILEMLKTKRNKIVQLNWKEMTTEDINQIYQSE